MQLKKQLKSVSLNFAFRLKTKLAPQNYLDDPFIELRRTMQKLKSLGLDKIPEELTPKDFANFDDSLAATEPILFD